MRALGVASDIPRGGTTTAVADEAITDLYRAHWDGDLHDTIQWK